MKGFRELELFVRAAEAGSLSMAARLLDLSPAVASAMLKRLEADLGVMLFVRSTRSLRLTQAGEAYLQHARQALEELAAGWDAIQQGSQAPRGVLQLSLPSDLGRNLVLSWLDEFLADYPLLELRLDLSDQLADVYRQRVDLALRYGIPDDSALVALPVAPENRRVLCAAPSYLHRHGMPATLDELAHHRCLCFMLDGFVYNRWRLLGAGREQVIEVPPICVSSDGDVVRRWAVAGQGIAYKSALDISEDLLAGRLVALLPQYQGESAPLNLVCPGRRQILPHIQALHALLQQRSRDRLEQLQRLQEPSRTALP